MGRKPKICYIMTLIICNTRKLIKKLYFNFALFRYGLAQYQFLPTGNYKFEIVAESLIDKILQNPKDSKKGYIIECDLEYPEKLHEKHKGFPLAPHKAEVTPDLLSPYQIKCHEKLGSVPRKSFKLIADFRTREKYVLHYENLKLYLRLGMKLKKVHRVLSFNQAPFLKPFIEACTKMRQNAKSDLAKNFFKLISNSCYGKTIENPSKYVNIKFVNDKEKLRRLLTEPNFDSYKIISERLVLVFMKNKNITVKQPCGVGFVILELSKNFMYESYYNEILPAFGDSTMVCFSDTDSLFLAVDFSKNPHKKIEHILDTSNFNKNHPMYDPSRKSQLGYFKSETADNKIKKFVGLRSKCYAFETEDKLVKKCKGIAKNFRKKIPLSAYEKCLESITSHSTDQYTLSSKSHNIRLLKSRKLCFSSFDDKTYLLKCGIHSVPYFSKSIKENLDFCFICEKMK